MPNEQEPTDATIEASQAVATPAADTTTAQGAPVPVTTPPTPPVTVPTLGRIVLFVFSPRDGVLVERPAVVVALADATQGLVNLRVFTDGANDAPYGEPALYARAVPYDGSASHEQTWHWPVGWSGQA